jgi:hypothetical protein
MDDLMLQLSVLDGSFAICRLDGAAPIPDWSLRGSFYAVVRTADELSVVCPQVDVPRGTTCDGGWRCLKVNGPLDLSLVGVLSSLATPLARAGISVFAVSTYDTDYLMVRAWELARCILVLSQAGHQVRGDSMRTSPDDVGKERDDE